jgi:pyruvate,water dikinase
LEWLIALGGLEAARPALTAAFHTARTYLGLREAAKHYMMMGYALIRAALVELGRRFGLGDGIFFLELSEIPRLIEGGDVATLRRQVDQRRRQRKMQLAIHAPPVIFSDDLESIGRPVVIEGAAELKGTPVSFGAFEGAALVLTEPVAPAGVADGFVLVCPSTDPAWVPLFLRAKALVMETGGVLSHGAIVAREFGIPAVAGFPDLCAKIRTGQRLRVDGTSGLVHVFEDAQGD